MRIKGRTVFKKKKKKKKNTFRRVPEIDNIGLDKGKVSVELGMKYK